MDKGTIPWRISRGLKWENKLPKLKRSIKVTYDCLCEPTYTISDKKSKNLWPSSDQKSEKEFLLRLPKPTYSEHIYCWEALLSARLHTSQVVHQAGTYPGFSSI